MSQARFTSSTKNETSGRQLLAGKHSRHHLVILGSLAAAIFIGLSVLPSEEVEANRQAAHQGEHRPGRYADLVDRHCTQRFKFVDHVSAGIAGRQRRSPINVLVPTDQAIDQDASG